MSDLKELSKEAFYEQESAKLKKQKKGLTQQEVMKKIDGMWRNYQESKKKADKAAKKADKKEKGR